MAINKKLLHFATKTNFSTQLANSNIDSRSIVFIKDTGEIWTHDKLYSCASWGTNQTNYVPLTISGVSYNLSKDGHTHSYLPLSGGQLTGQLILLQGAGGGITFPNDSFGGSGDSASIKLLNPAGGESTEMTFTMTNDVDDIINFSVPSIDGVKVNRYTVWNAGNFTNLNQLTTRNFIDLQNKPTTLSGYGITDALSLSGGTMTGDIYLNSNKLRYQNNSVYLEADGLGAGLVHSNQGGYIKFGPLNAVYAHIYTDRPQFYFNKDLLVNDNIVWHSGNDGSGSGLDADTLDGIHLQNILEKQHSGSSASGTATGWFRIGMLLGSNAEGHSGILIIKRNYHYANNESYVFSISGAYYGGISITQLSGYANSRLIDKIRIDYTNGGESYIELHIATSTTTNFYGWSTIGAAKSYTTWTAVSDTPVGTSYEFTTVNGCKSDRGFTGNLSGNSSSATKLQTGRYLFGQYFDGTGDVNGDCVINRNSADTGIKINNDSNIYSTIRFNDTSGNFATIHAFSDVGYLYNGEKSINIDTTAISLGHWNDPVLYVKTNAKNVGINTTNPAYKLDVAGTLRATGAVYTNVGVKSRNICIETDNDGNASTKNSEINNFNSTLYLQHQTSNALVMCAGGGNVSIGTSAVGGNRLYVNGSIGTNQYIRAGGYISAGESADDSYGWINVTRSASIENASYFSMVRAGNYATGFGISTDNSIIIGGAASNRTIVDTYLKLNSQYVTTTKVLSSSNRIFTGYDSGVANSISCSNWFRSSDATGWYNSTYGGGIWMSDSTYVKVYGNKAFWVDNNIVATGVVTASRLYAGYDSGVANTISCSGWFRSNGSTGWYNATYGGGICMEDSTYVRVSHGKAFKVDSTASDSINTSGGVQATAGFTKTGYSDLYMLLAGGGTKLLSDFRLKSEKVLRMVFRGYFKWSGTNSTPSESNVVYSDFCTSYSISRVSTGRYRITFTGMKTTSNIAADTTLQIFGAGRNINSNDGNPCYVAISYTDTNYFDIIVADDASPNDTSAFTLYINQML